LTDAASARSPGRSTDGAQPSAGQHASEQRSLFGEILDWMLAPLLLLWPMSVALTWLVAQGIANRPYDRELGELARAVARRVVVESGPARSRCRSG
jgi:two-component system sensor histidine kinase TctE